MNTRARVAVREHGRPRAGRGAAALLACALVVTLAACASRPGAATSPSPTEFSPSPTSSSTTSPTPEPLASDAAPTAIPTDPALPDPVPTAAGTAKVTIVNSGADGRTVYASGLVTGESTPGGVCTLTATSGDTVVSAEIEAQSTPAALNCGLIEIPAPAGSWSLTLTYRSDAVTVVSDAVTVRQS